jgi:hypothetical protein
MPSDHESGPSRHDRSLENCKAGSGSQPSLHNFTFESLVGPLRVTVRQHRTFRSFETRKLIWNTGICGCAGCICYAAMFVSVPRFSCQRSPYHRSAKRTFSESTDGEYNKFFFHPVICWRQHCYSQLCGPARACTLVISLCSVSHFHWKQIKLLKRFCAQLYFQHCLGLAHRVPFPEHLVLVIDSWRVIYSRRELSTWHNHRDLACECSCAVLWSCFHQWDTFSDNSCVNF